MMPDRRAMKYAMVCPAKEDAKPKNLRIIKTNRSIRTMAEDPKLTKKD